MSDLARFAIEMSALADRIERAADRAVRTASLQILSQVTILTPVDTGRARANWIVSIGSPAQIEKPWTGSAGGAASSAINEGTKAIVGASFGPTVYVQNNIPYISRLNNGWSRQAPAGFVEKSIDSAIRALATKDLFA